MSRRVLQLSVVLGLVFVAAGLLLAQEEAAAEATPVGKSWFELFKSTGVVGILLLATSIIGTGLLLQYVLTITEAKLGNPQLLSDVGELLGDGNFDDAYATAEADTTYAGRVLTGALGRATGGYEGAIKGMEETAAVESFRLNAKISYLSLVGNIGPLLGLLGTVTGMISSFQRIEQIKAPTPADLAHGVYESLVNTTIGLFIAIIFLSAYFFMKNKVSDLTLRINNQVSDLLAQTMSSPAGSSSS
jgi:biopolymer transport protein ExbB